MGRREGLGDCTEAQQLAKEATHRGERLAVQCAEMLEALQADPISEIFKLRILEYGVYSRGFLVALRTSRQVLGSCESLM